MTEQQQFNREYKAAWEAWARRADDGNPLGGILIACAVGLAMWLLLGYWIIEWLR